MLFSDLDVWSLSSLLVWPWKDYRGLKRGVKVKINRAYSSYFPHGPLRGIFTCLDHILLWRLSSFAQKEAVGGKYSQQGGEKYREQKRQHNCKVSQSLSSCCHVTLNEKVSLLCDYFSLRGLTAHLTMRATSAGCWRWLDLVTSQ